MKELLHGVKSLLAVMGEKSVEELNQKFIIPMNLYPPRPNQIYDSSI